MTILHICILASNYKLSSEVKGQFFYQSNFLQTLNFIESTQNT